MKQFTLILLFVFNFSYSSKIEGYYITSNDEKVNALFNIPTDLLSKEINFQAIVFGIKYYDEKGDKQKLNLDNVKEIRFEYLGEKTILKCLLNTCNLGTNYIGDTKYVLLQPIEEGVISTYFYPKSVYNHGIEHGSVSVMPSFSSLESAVLVKPDGKMVETSSGSFKNKMKDFFSDCPELVKKIEEKIYKRKHLKEMIEDYKKNCAMTK